jgi:hypothetical protein
LLDEDDINAFRTWIELDPEIPEGEWYKDFGTFKLAGEAALAKTFLTPGQAARGKRL